MDNGQTSRSNEEQRRTLNFCDAVKLRFESTGLFGMRPKTIVKPTQNNGTRGRPILSSGKRRRESMSFLY